MRVMLLANSSASMVWFRVPLLRTMVQKGHEVLVVAPDGSGVLDIEACGVTFIPLRKGRRFANPLSDLRTVWNLRGLVRQFKPDVFLAYTPKMVVLGCIAAWLGRAPAIHGMLTGLGYAQLDGGWIRRLMRVIFYGVIRIAGWFAQSIIVLNPDNRDSLIQSGTVPASRIYHMDGEGIDMSRFSLSPMAYEKGEAVFLMVARLVRFKGCVEYAEAARRVRVKYPAARFLLAGGEDPNHPDAVPPKQLAEWGESGVVELLGHVANIHEIMEGAHCIVLPSYTNEGLPMSTMEAMAVGRPVITTATAGNRETVEEGVNGFLVPMGNVDLLVKGLLAICEDPAAASRMGLESRRIAEHRFDASIVNEALLIHLGLN